ncbi:MAG: hypothetical protein ACI8QF_000671 [Limisphaerales bacterium]|jgi:hypothetical protein
MKVENFMSKPSPGSKPVTGASCSTRMTLKLSISKLKFR